MSRPHDIPDVSQWDHYDLMNFNDYRLTSAGELEMGPRPGVDAVLKLGHNILSLTSLALDDDAGTADQRSTLYVVRNLTARSKNAIATLDDTPREAGSRFVGDHLMDVYESPAMIIGRGEDATPELQLDDTASRYHTSLRIGALARRLHIADLYSRNGTHVYLNPALRHSVTSPARRFVGSFQERNFITYEQQQGRWTRRGE